MATVKTIRVSVGYTKNAGNYESARIEQSLELELDEGEKTSEVMAETREYLKVMVLNDANEHVKYMKAQRR